MTDEKPEGQQWPTLPGGPRPHTDPLQVPQRQSLAPQQLPTRAEAPAPAPEVPGSPQDAPSLLPPDRGQRVPCPQCRQLVPTYAAFCEACGAALSPTTAAPGRSGRGSETPLGEGPTGVPAEGAGAQPQPPPGAPATGDVAQAGAPADPSRPATPAVGNSVPRALPPDPDLEAPKQRGCPECGGVVGPDGYCTNCGAKATRQRDHYTEQPASWVAGVCDRGIRHSRNEDALATAADVAPGSRAILVVCDGVSTSQDSDVAALAGARKARDVLSAVADSATSAAQDRDPVWADAFAAAAREANAAVIATTAADSTNAASCTFVAAVVEQGRMHVANVGDSRAYWLPDAGDASLLTVDDSIAQARIAMGVSREEAEHGYQAHAITKWLGRDAEDIAPRVAAQQPDGPGWLLVCSDGLWNYCTEPDALGELLRSKAGAGIDPLPVAEALARWACDQGGKDNISVALARLEGATPAAGPDDHGPINLDADTVPTKQQ